MIYRIGNGFDFHKFQKPKIRPFLLGGVELQTEVSIEAHSDGDVLLHSVADALLGAMAMGDIGDYFPDTNEEFKNVDSKLIIKKVNQIIATKNLQIENIDTTIITEIPKISPFKEKIRKSLSDFFQIDISQISLKATTMEQSGTIGRKEGIAVLSSVLIKKK